MKIIKIKIILNHRIEELTVFIRVKIDNLNEFSNSIPLKLNKKLEQIMK